MKTTIFFFLVILSSTVDAQFKVSSVTVDEKNITLENDERYYSTFQGGNSYLIDTFLSSFLISFDLSNSTINNGKILYNLKYGGASTPEEQSFSIEFDTTNNEIVSMKASILSKEYPNLPDTTYYWSSTFSGIFLQNIPYTTSKNGDSLKINLSSNELRKLSLPSLSISQYNEESTPHTSLSMDGKGSRIINYPDSAYLKVSIIGNFPLSVTSFSNSKANSIIIDGISKVLKLAGQHLIQNLIQNQPLPCYDLLGRKHNLEFLGTDGASSTYSVRSLPAGVYFVSDGREMVKFFITD